MQRKQHTTGLGGPLSRANEAIAGALLEVFRRERAAKEEARKQARRAARPTPKKNSKHGK
jgi:hypothetical protein